MFKCPKCSKSFKTQQAVKQHKRDAHDKHRDLRGIPKHELAELAGDIFEDLPDGAFFQAAHDTFGLDPEDFIDE